MSMNTQQYYFKKGKGKWENCLCVGVKNSNNMTVCGFAIQMLHDPVDNTVSILLLYISSGSNSRLLY